MKLSVGLALGLMSLNDWAQPARAEIEVFSCMAPVKTAEGVFSGKRLISSFAENNTVGSLHVRLMDHSFGNSYGKPYVGKSIPQLDRWSYMLIMLLSGLRTGRDPIRSRMARNHCDIQRTSI